MFDYISVLNKQKGVSVIQALVALAMITTMAGAVTVKGSEVLAEAKDTQRVANVKQLAIACEIYYLGNGHYPQVSGTNSEERFNQFIVEIKDDLISLPTGRLSYDYQNSNNGQDYVLRVALDDSGSSYLEAGQRGVINGLDCDGQYYCIKN